jgi:hypothetical protein
MVCSIVISFGMADGGSLVMEGLVKKPSAMKLLAGASDRALAVVGGTGPYDAARGRAKPDGMGNLVVGLK